MTTLIGHGIALAAALLAATTGNLLSSSKVTDGWALDIGHGQAHVERHESGGPDGGAFIEIIMPGDGQADMRSAAGFVDLQPDTAYLLTCAAKASNVAAGSHAAELQWFGPGGFISLDGASATVADTWARIAVGPVRPPAGATRVIVLLRAYHQGAYAFDDVALTALAQMPGGTLPNGSFESDADRDAAPDHWMPQGNATIDTQNAASGRLCVRGDASSGWGQGDIAVTPLAKYELTAKTRADTFGRTFRLAITWQTADGETIATDEMTDQTWENWQTKTLRAVAPAKATAASVMLENIGEGTVWFDDAQFTERGRSAEIALQLVAPDARGLIRDGVDPRVVRITCVMTCDDPDFSLRLRLVDRQDNVLTEHTPDWTQGDVVWEPDISQLPIGGYRITAEAVRPATGAVLADGIACLDIVAADAPGLTFRSDHIAMLDGKPWFPIGVTSFGPDSPHAERLANAGFNLLVPGSFTNGEPTAVQATLDKAASLGLYVMEWNDGHVYHDTPADERHRRFTDSVAKIDSHPHFIGWLCDEALWNGIPESALRDSYLFARSIAPSLVYWQNQAPRNSIADLTRYSRWSDVTGVDIYPVEGGGHSDLPNKTLSVVGDEVDKQHVTVDRRKPVWAILQGAGWGAWESDPAAHKRAPSWIETRFMAYDAILHGATGIVYWGGHYEDQESDVWHAVRRIARELSDLMPVLVAADRPPVTVDGAGVIATARHVDGKWWIIAVNETDAAAQATIGGLGDVTRVERFAEPGEPIAVTNGTLGDTFEPWGVHIYRQP